MYHLPMSELPFRILKNRRSYSTTRGHLVTIRGVTCVLEDSFLHYPADGDLPIFPVSTINLKYYPEGRPVRRSYLSLVTSWL